MEHTTPLFKILPMQPIPVHHSDNYSSNPTSLLPNLPPSQPPFPPPATFVSHRLHISHIVHLATINPENTETHIRSPKISYNRSKSIVTFMWRRLLQHTNLSIANTTNNTTISHTTPIFLLLSLFRPKIIREP